MIVRCTAKLRALLGVTPSELVDADPTDDDWYVDVLELGTRPGLVAIHAGTLFCVCIPRLRAAELADPARALVTAVGAELAAERLPAGVLGPLDAADARYAKTASRSVLGHLAESIRTAHAITDHAGGVSRISATWLAGGLQRTIRFLDGHAVFALELACARAAALGASVDTVELRVELEDMPAPVWRELALPADASLADLHDVLLVAFGWNDSHLAAFQTDAGWQGPSYQPRAQLEFADEALPADDVAVATLLGTPHQRLWWLYDFGDGWTHRITTTGRRHTTDTAPRCRAGERAAPPDDCGGSDGYAELLDALADPDHPEHDALRHWLGAPYDPDASDPDRVERSLRTVRPSRVAITP